MKRRFCKTTDLDAFSIDIDSARNLWRELLNRFHGLDGRRSYIEVTISPNKVLEFDGVDELVIQHRDHNVVEDDFSRFKISFMNAECSIVIESKGRNPATISVSSDNEEWCDRMISEFKSILVQYRRWFYWIGHRNLMRTVMSLYISFIVIMVLSAIVNPWIPSFVFHDADWSVSGIGVFASVITVLVVAKIWLPFCTMKLNQTGSRRTWYQKIPQSYSSIRKWFPEIQILIAIIGVIFMILRLFSGGL